MILHPILSQCIGTCNKPKKQMCLRGRRERVKHLGRSRRWEIAVGGIEPVDRTIQGSWFVP